jgi:hypothetical protein
MIAERCHCAVYAPREGGGRLVTGPGAVGNVPDGNQDRILAVC